MTSQTQSPPAAVLRMSGGLHLLTWPALDASAVDAVVTARAGGVSSGPYESLNLSLSVGDDPGRVLENRRRLAAAFGADPGDFVFARQVHGAGVRVVGSADRGSGAFSLDDAVDGADALVTSSPGVMLAILTADCVPVVLHDPQAGVLACVHAGWRGTAAGVAAAAVAAMADLGARPGGIVAGIGPAVPPDRYQVGPDVHQAVTRSFGPAAAAFIRPDPGPGPDPRLGPAAAAFIRPDPGPESRPGPRPAAPQDRWLLDLWAANRHALREAGVPDAQIHITDIPTGPVNPTDPGLFFSDRAARPCGRLAVVARLRAPRRNSMDVTL
jgi:purine-nucleoside/S-methyl-5'-thioadenosine phosphorylase / adenosine deaminase